MKRPDCLVIGSGIAGLTFALKVAARHPGWHILIATKSKVMECNTRYAQGGIAAVWDELADDFDKHFRDTMKAGQFRSNPDVVKMVVEKGPDRVVELIQWGVEFDTDADGKLQLGLEGGHSAKRVLHHKDFTGLEIEKKLWNAIKKQINVTVLEYCMALDLLMDEGKVCGARIFNTKEEQILEVNATLTVLASGGIGQLFANTTNPEVATADGLAMAIRAGAKTRNLQFVQFHPTMLYNKGQSDSLLISEALRGFGAHLVNHTGERFMFKYHENGELATRDVVSGAIFSEMKKERTAYQFLDCRHLNSEKLELCFPFVVDSCRLHGIDPVSELIPIVPAAHYHCGGVAVDKFGCSSLPHLMALGECAETGLHGTNRLASNSLLEALVFADQAAIKSPEIVENNHFKSVRVCAFRDYSRIINKDELLELKKTIKSTMSNYFIIRNNPDKINKALKAVQEMEKEVVAAYSDNYLTSFYELKNMVLVAGHILLAALSDCTENEGTNEQRCKITV